MTNHQLTGLGANHPANSHLSDGRLVRVRTELERMLSYRNGSAQDYFIADAVKAIDELIARRKADEPIELAGNVKTGFSDDGLHEQLSRLEKSAAEERAMMDEWDRPANKSELRHRAERLATDARELADRLSSPDGEPE